MSSEFYSNYIDSFHILTELSTEETLEKGILMVGNLDDNDDLLVLSS